MLEPAQYSEKEERGTEREEIKVRDVCSVWDGHVCVLDHVGVEWMRDGVRCKRGRERDRTFLDAQSGLFPIYRANASSLYSF